ncbi:4-alpha-glucanotransferase [uncultured Roseibium sp.]|uniref:4-alpha-glucanotransferase n=1 Tax=uncultured Roseibium sp. TaxID=1936171 RepID=UPI002626FB24|nr:4-alpha-glucanotransferase [uncultured Roseibium sp.]
MMSADVKLRALARECGVYLEFRNLAGQKLEAEPPTLRALLGGLGYPTATDAEISEALAERQAVRHGRKLPEELVLEAGSSTSIAVPTRCDWSIVSENGDEVQTGTGSTAISIADLPVGYFLLHAAGEGWSEDLFLLSPPTRAPSLSEAAGTNRCWGVCGALYGLRSRTNGGLGNYSDLGVAAAALGRSGAQFFGINPIHALGWAAQETISPYSPTHRGFFNTDHLSAASDLGSGPREELIDYEGFRAMHRAVLETEYAVFAQKSSDAEQIAFRTYCGLSGQALSDFATFEALSEKHGEAFQRWPKALQTPGRQAQAEVGERATFHKWMQWRAEEQIGAAQQSATSSGMQLGLYLDLAVGPRRGGAEVWTNGKTIAEGISIGAPPDHLSPKGQSWDLAAHAPNKLSANHYQPLRSMLGSLMNKCGLLRIDHALGLLRSYWLPDDGSPGGYVSQPFEALLAVIAIEACRNGCVVVGEDLGLVPDGFREGLNNAGLYSYAVWQYETDDQEQLVAPRDLRSFSLACFGTHDTPTMAGFWHGIDIDWWREIGWLNSSEAHDRHGVRAHQRNGLRRLCELGTEMDTSRIGDTIHAGLAGSQAAMIAIQLDDLFGVTEAQNLPGTIDQHPNWRRRLPVPIEQFPIAASPARLRDLMPSTRNSIHENEQKGLEPCPK